jgi:uncharacterized repeat protein (TIGR01451 family)/MYXO-CTERM domain-containing protein
MRRSLASVVTAALVLGSAGAARADTFAAGSLIIPMDTTYQDAGMLKAYGLVYALLHGGVPVSWVIQPGKAFGAADFTASAKDHKGGAALGAHGYRGGPFVIAAANAAAALPIIDTWQTANTGVAVHEATAGWTATVARRLVAAPRVAMHADGSQNIAVSYLNAAGIPDSNGNPWPSTSPDLLTPAQVAGPTTTNHKDGSLFDKDGDPVYCQFMSMHWNVTSAQATPEVVAEVRSFLTNPVHFFAECQAVDAFENLVPHGHFLTPNGFLIKSQPSAVDMVNAGQTFMQIDGAFGTVGGSEPAYALPAGDSYKAGGVTMITAHGQPAGAWDLWMTGYLDGACPPDAENCGYLGKVSYLGGHQYTTSLPMSKNPKTQGVRLFLNSLFDSTCAADTGVPHLVLTKTAPETTVSASVTFTLDYANYGPTVALGAVLSDAVPAGATFVSATSGGTFAAGKVSWSLGNLGVAESGSVSFTVTLGGHGTYANTAALGYLVGLNPFTLASNTTSTVFDADTDGDGFVDAVDTCPQNANPGQDLQTDPLSCGTCGHVCPATGGQPICVAGICSVVGCDPTKLATDPKNCGSCGHACSFPNAGAICVGSVCQMANCLAGHVDANHDPADGCEYACVPTAASDTTCDGIDDDCDGQIDEDFVPTSCGVGACATLSTCTLGVASCTPLSPGVEGPAGAASCSDGIDNDCDGVADGADGDCQTAACQSAADCDDGDPCTSDTCASGFCAHAGIDCGTGGTGGSTGTTTGTNSGTTTGTTTGTGASGGAGTGGSTGTTTSGGGGTIDGTGAATSSGGSGDQGTCSCRAAGAEGDEGGGLAAWLGVAALAGWRGRRRQGRSGATSPLPRGR